MTTWQPRTDPVIEMDSAGSNAQPAPKIVTDWLAKLRLLYGVPFEYLVPDTRLLPMESIRFFHIDENWINTMVDGAVSIGRVNRNDLAHDRQTAEELKRKSCRNLVNIRRRLQKKPDIDAGSTGAKTGFILRSVVVEGWPGLEIKAFPSETGDSPCQPLRLERLAKDVMLGIFDGTVNRLELREPAEAMHFGADLEEGVFSKTLRSTGVKLPLGTQLEVRVDKVPFRTSDSRTVDVTRLVSDIKSKLDKAGELGPEFSAAEFALEMIESAQEGVFHNDGK